jgi:hypothetical protein
VVEELEEQLQSAETRVVILYSLRVLVGVEGIGEDSGVYFTQEGGAGGVGVGGATSFGGDTGDHFILTPCLSRGGGIGESSGVLFYTDRVGRGGKAARVVEELAEVCMFILSSVGRKREVVVGGTIVFLGDSGDFLQVNRMGVGEGNTRRSM